MSFTFPILSERPPIWSGAEITTRDLMFHSVGERIFQRTSGSSQWGIISFDPKFFADTSEALAGSEIVPPRVGQVLRPLRSDMINLRRHFAKVCRLAEEGTKTIAHREVIRAIEHEITHALINCLLGQVIHDDTAARRRHATIMNRFEAALTTSVDQQLTVPELCRAVGVTECSLRMSCREFLGMGPKQYIRLRRLNLLHAALQNTEPATAQVADIAHHYGFSELGRLAGFYRTIFGETPNVTLQQSHDKSHNTQFAETT